MITDELRQYVSKIKASGEIEAKIKEILAQAKWSQEDIDQVIPPLMQYCGLGRRISANVIDFLIWFMVFGFLLAKLFGQTTEGGFNLTGLPALILLILGGTYYILFEGLMGATPGKMLFKIRVVNEDGSKCNLKTSLIRNLLRVVDYLPFLYITGLIVISKSDKKQRLGDKIAHTVVVKV